MNWCFSVYILTIINYINSAASQITDCDQVFKSSHDHKSGMFTSPSFPRKYIANMQCLYIFEARRNERVKIEFEDFNLHGYVDQCDRDYIDIYSELQVAKINLEWGNFTISGRYCGQVMPQIRISLYNFLIIGFYSDGTKESTGFNATYEFINNDIYQISPPVPGTICDFIIRSTSIREGIILTPTYPGSYPANLDCTYKFRGRRGQRVRLEFFDFDIYAGGDHCPYDSVTLYDGIGPSYCSSSPYSSHSSCGKLRVIGGGPYCGEYHRLVMFSTAENLEIRFKTTEAPQHENRGFNATFKFSDAFVNLKKTEHHIIGTECSQRILSTGDPEKAKGTIQSPNMSKRNRHVIDIMCNYNLDGLKNDENLEKVKLEFKEFKGFHTNMTDGICVDGFVAVFQHGHDTRSAPQYTFCGDNIPETITSQGPRLMVLYHSGTKLPGGKFRAEYSFETDYGIRGTPKPDSQECEFTYRGSNKESGIINSPRYPANYPSKKNCTFLMYAKPKQRIRLQFSSLKMFFKPPYEDATYLVHMGSNCSNADYVEVYFMITPDKYTLVGRYCKYQVPGPVLSPVNSTGVKVNFISHKEGKAQGFHATYYFVSDEQATVAACSRHFKNKPGGVLTSPYFNVKYQSKTFCDWEITVKKGERIMLHFSNWLSVEGNLVSMGCGNAAVRVYLNDTEGEPYLEFCNGDANLRNEYRIMTSTDNYMRVTFTTGDKLAGMKGFKAAWVAYRPDDIECRNGFKCKKSGFCISKKVCDIVPEGKDTTSKEMSYCGLSILESGIAEKDTSDRSFCSAVTRPTSYKKLMSILAICMIVFMV